MPKKRETEDRGDEPERQAPTVRKRTTITLKCQLTDQEILQCGQAVADALEAAAELERELDEFKTMHKAKVAQQEAIVGLNTGKIRSRYEYRPVECEVVKDYGAGVVWTERVDTREIIERRPLTDEERQMALAIVGEGE